MSADSLKQIRAGLIADGQLRGTEWCREWAGRADGWLARLFAEAAPEGGRGLALLAVGGYGRALLAPGSDLDLLLLHDGRRKRLKELADAIWYPIWDSGQPLDH
ncbi:MAG TPA: hypothetical protein VKI19_10300, partial [Acidimicrobiales bacterium]|nr:hypothetical protein [Acidimicrobiales bacterium]